MKIAVCSAKRKDSEALKKLLLEYAADNDTSFSVSEYISDDALISAVNAGAMPDTVFLDITDSKSGGISPARKIRKSLSDIPIVIVASDTDFALEGYKVRASAFLIKSSLKEDISECMDNILDEYRRKSRILRFRCVEGIMMLKTDEIVFIETSGHKCLIHITEGSCGTYEKLKYLAELLKNFGFLRIHQSYLVNMKYIRTINNYTAVLTDGTVLPVPKARYKDVKKEYSAFLECAYGISEI